MIDPSVRAKTKTELANEFKLRLETFRAWLKKEGFDITSPPPVIYQIYLKFSFPTLEIKEEWQRHFA